MSAWAPREQHRGTETHQLAPKIKRAVKTPVLWGIFGHMASTRFSSPPAIALLTFFARFTELISGVLRSAHDSGFSDRIYPIRFTSHVATDAESLHGLYFSLVCTNIIIIRQSNVAFMQRSRGANHWFALIRQLSSVVFSWMSGVPASKNQARIHQSVNQSIKHGSIYMCT